MKRQKLPLKEVSIEELFLGNEKSIYEIPIYQRNYAWEKDEISALVQDIYDAYKKDCKSPYYIGTLVSYFKGDGIYEIIDGQQRLTTLRLMLSALEIEPNNKLTYRARKKSDDTIKSIPKFDVDEKDKGIENGYKYVKTAIGDIDQEDQNGFVGYFREKVHIIHYIVPKDIDLNHYFEVMNSRGEQLEKHEIVKANLMKKLDNDDERLLFNHIWESCAEMSVYLQQNIDEIKPENIFGFSLDDFLPSSFDEIMDIYLKERKKDESSSQIIPIEEIIRSGWKDAWKSDINNIERKDSFLPIIDFPNFLLIVLKLTRLDEKDFLPGEFILDDKELLNEFHHANMNARTIKKFAFNLLKMRYYLDNYIVHHSKEEDTIDSNPWKLQVWHKDKDTKKGQLKNLSENQDLQNKLAQLLSMFEVSFTARQRKNYLFYCMIYLMDQDKVDIDAYSDFVEELADRYFNKVYLNSNNLNAKNTPSPGSFDEEMLSGNQLSKKSLDIKGKNVFVNIYGDGYSASRGIPLFVFNYLDFKLWKMYATELRGEKTKEGSIERQEFFKKLGCGDFGLKVFRQFYFSRTRRSLEHYYPQANATGIDGCLNQNQINCFGNYAMIGSEANSAGSNWTPKAKLNYYLDSSKKISQISVASLKFMIMMQVCKENQKWDFEDICKHQDNMLKIIMSDKN